MQKRRVILVDPNHLEGHINAKILSSTIEDAEVYDFRDPFEARDFVQRYGICPDVIVLSESFDALRSQIDQWLTECDSNCELYTMCDVHSTRATTAKNTVSRSMLHDQLQQIMSAS